MKQIVSSIKLVLLISGLALKGCASFAMVVVTRSRQALPANALQRLSSNTLHVSKKLRSTTSTEKNYRRAAAKIESTSRKERRNNSRSKRDQIIPTNFNIATPVPLSTDKRDPLLKLPSDCVTAKFICRPSKRNRSPYVADIFVPSLDREAICHVPNLDMGGKCFPGVTLLVKPQRDRKGKMFLTISVRRRWVAVMTHIHDIL
uniref:Uncharacterized protein n=1 Tax=Corethron hystrix TaxID=216773 RepID=A0A7S1FTJ9_9STRA|mmetsp:Transcript_27790/g.63649  ORF Transcript_27790/g.63649 Transcript_27790/m.63649 type:complete len:203 (+) Transcript_27790:99-707(+)